jgi:hypothetical protein
MRTLRAQIGALEQLSGVGGGGSGGGGGGGGGGGSGGGGGGGVARSVTATDLLSLQRAADNQVLL